MKLSQIIDQHCPRRFDPIVKHDERYGNFASMKDGPSGDWVSYDDYRQIIECLAESMRLLENIQVETNSINDMTIGIVSAINQQQ